MSITVRPKVASAPVAQGTRDAVPAQTPGPGRISTHDRAHGRGAERAVDRGTGPAVECRDLVVRYGRVVAVDGLSFTIEHGEVLAMLGPNGAGKTTTVETLEGYRQPTSGTVRVLGRDPHRDHRNVVAHIGVMLQRGGIYPTMTSSQVLKLFSRYYDDPEDPAALIDLLGLGNVSRTPWRRLSGGEQQRLSLALALIGKPDVLFLDEPTAGVDPEGRVTIRRVVSQLRDRGSAVLLTTHELAEVERVADRVVILAQGRSIGAGTLEELGNQTKAPGILFETRAGIDLPGLATAIGVEAEVVTESEPGSYRVEAEGTPERVAALTAWLASSDLTIRNLRTGGGGLEEVYLSLVDQSRTQIAEQEPTQ